MVTAAKLRAIAAQRGVDLPRDPSAVIVATAATATGLVELAQELDLIVLGLDGLQVDGAVVVPLIDFIADFGDVPGAWDDRVRACAASARDVLDEWSGGPDLIEFTLDGLDG